MKRSLLFLLLVLSSNLYAQVVEKNLSGEYANSNGIYGKFTIAVDHNELTGYYEYYDKYDPVVKGYLQAFEFFIKGVSKDGKNFNIIAANLDFPNENSKGTLVFANNKLKIILNETPSPGCAFDITEDGEANYFPMAKPLKILRLTYVNANKASLKTPLKAQLFDLINDNFVIRKGYLLSGDLVTIVENRDTFSKVLYKSQSGKISTYWVKTSDLLDPFLNNWSGFTSNIPPQHIKLD
jgi:hypothetical protein